MMRRQPAATGQEPLRPSPVPVRVGLVGRNIQKSRTPAMHEAEGAALGLAYSYDLIDAAAMPPADARLDRILDRAERDGFAGLNVTYPYKVDVLQYLDDLSDAVDALGAVNTVVFRDGRRIGHNTDLWGFAESFRSGMANVRHGVAILIGAGGAGAAVGHALADCGVDQVAVFDIDPARSEALVHSIRARHGNESARVCSKLEAEAAGCDGIVNASPVGMSGVPGCPFPAGLIRPEMWVADIIYFPLETKLLRQARARGCRTLPGSGMAVFQAVRAFRHFTGHAADPLRMKATFDAFDREPRDIPQT